MIAIELLAAKSTARPSKRSRQEQQATLIVCEIVIPAKKTPSSFRRYSITNREIG